MNILIIAVLALVQGATELLPVSSSAHVIIVEKIFGLDPTSPAMTFLLVMLHTGTMIAVLVYFWSRWGKLLSKENPSRWSFVKMVVYGTIVTGIIGLGFLYLIQKVYMRGQPGGQVEDLFGNVWIIATGLALVGILNIVAGFRRGGEEASSAADASSGRSILVGAIQGLSLPFRGFSRSGSTISVGLLSGLSRRFAEEFSFALGFVLTVPVVAREALRLRHVVPAAGQGISSFPVLAGLIGMVLSFAAGYAAIRWLSAWLERGRWGWFGFYCTALSIALYVLAGTGVLA